MARVQPDCSRFIRTGVVLTDGNEDGAAGLRAVKAGGGVCIVQNPVEAREPSMPIHAHQADNPDYCVNLAGSPRCSWTSLRRTRAAPGTPTMPSPRSD